MFYNDDYLKVKDLKFENKGIFYYINLIKPFPFTEIVSPETLDLGFDMLHGGKMISPFVSNKLILEDNETVLIDLSKVIVSMFGRKWDIMINILEKDLNLDTFNLTTTETGLENDSKNSTRSDVTGSEKENLISSFDSELYSNDTKEVDSNTADSTETGTRNLNKEYTKTVSGNRSNKLDDVKRISDLLHNNVLNDIIYSDVGQLLGLSIY